MILVLTAGTDEAQCTPNDVIPIWYSKLAVHHINGPPLSFEHVSLFRVNVQIWADVKLCAYTFSQRDWFTTSNCTLSKRDDMGPPNSMVPQPRASTCKPTKFVYRYLFAQTNPIPFKHLIIKFSFDHYLNGKQTAPTPPLKTIGRRSVITAISFVSLLSA